MPRVRLPIHGLAKLLDDVASPLYLLDDERRVVYVNAACLSWLGCEAEQIVGAQAGYHSCENANSTDTVAAGLCPPPSVFDGSRTHATVSPGTAAGNPSVRPAEFLPLADEQGNTVLVLAIVAATNDSVSGEPMPDEPSGIDLHEAIREFRQARSATYRFDRLIGTSHRIERVRQQVMIALRSSVSVLLTGPRGSGKHHLARTIHDRSGEPWGPLVPLACGDLGPDLLRSTLEATIKNHPHQASNTPPTATLVLDEVDQLPTEVHSEFARLLAANSNGLRLIATAARPLDRLVAEGKFRSDLAYRISTLTIELPSLAERLDDLPLLAQMFLEDTNATGGKQVGSITPAALDQLAAYPWPGNLDELATLIASAHERAATAEITPRDLPERIWLSAEATARPRKMDDAVNLEQFLSKVERELITRALNRAKGNKTRAARLLGMTRPKLYRRLVQLGMEGD
jgi:transcriptional regulator with PAS, ATPase and Fis domain